MVGNLWALGGDINAPRWKGDLREGVMRRSYEELWGVMRSYEELRGVTRSYERKRWNNEGVMRSYERELWEGVIREDYQRKLWEEVIRGSYERKIWDGVIMRDFVGRRQQKRRILSYKYNRNIRHKSWREERDYGIVITRFKARSSENSLTVKTWKTAFRDKTFYAHLRASSPRRIKRLFA